MKNFFCFLSGENPELAALEVESILKGENKPYRELLSLPQCLVFESNEQSVASISNRAAFTKIISELYFACTSEEKKILEATKKLEINSNEGELGFKVEIIRVRGSSKHVSTQLLTKEIGAIIKSKKSTFKVNLERPKITYLGLLIQNKFIFGKKLEEVDRTKLLFGRGVSLPIVRSGMMNAALARAMVNLAHVKKGDVVLDPFCGPGGILVEALNINCKAIGIDLNPQIVELAKINLLFTGKTDFEVKVGDACSLNEKVDAIVTDPPYSISTSSYGRSHIELLKKFIPSAFKSLKKGKYMCISYPNRINIHKYAEEIGFKLVASFNVYLHRHLIRKVDLYFKP